MLIIQATLLTLFAFGLKEPSVRLVGIILIICAGVLIASLGEADFHLPGFIIQVRGLCQTWLTPQCTAIAVEATRLALIQTLLQGSNFTPLTSLYSFAPVCFGTLALLIVPVEGLEALRALPQVGLQLIPNAALTFLLSASLSLICADSSDVAAIYLVAISSLVLSLSKVAKGARHKGDRADRQTSPSSSAPWRSWVTALICSNGSATRSPWSGCSGTRPTAEGRGR